MGFRFPYLKYVPLLTVASGLAVSSVHAQRMLPPGQAILFSSPESDTVVSNLSSLSPRPPQSEDFGSTLEAPQTFNFTPSPACAPMSLGTPAVSSTEQLRMQDLLDRRNNWMLMTPAEIYGVTTPEMILGIPARDASGQRKQTTALERYTERQNQTPPPANPYTNAMPSWNSFDKRPDTFDSMNGGLGNRDGLASTLLKPPPDYPANENNSWSKLFGPPAQASAASPARQTEMDRFKQLLMSGSSSADAAAPSVRGMKISVPQSPLDSSLGQPAINPIGGTYAPLSDGIGKPAGLPKMPSAWMSLTSAPPTATWAPQPPPWQTLQPFAAPQRKF